jgi:uncharacterized protein (DUF302 family)
MLLVPLPTTSVDTYGERGGCPIRSPGGRGRGGHPPPLSDAERLTLGDPEQVDMEGGPQVAHTAGRSEPDVVTKVSPRSVSETVARFTDLLSAKGVRLFAVIDQADQARQVGLELRETVLVLFGNPKAGTPVMEASPLAALDLPLKILVWAGEQETMVSYPTTAALAARHHLSPQLAGNLAVIDALTDALVAA